MSAIVCGKRSSFFEEIPSSSASSSPVSKRIRYSSSSPVRYSPPRSGSILLDHLASIFPDMDKKLLEQALENNGNDLELAIKSLNDLCLLELATSGLTQDLYQHRHLFGLFC